MKKLFLGMLAIAAMASCSENEVILDGTQKTIGFAPAQFGNSVISRATTTELGKTIKLGVYAYQTAGNPAVLYINDVLSCQSDAWKLSQTYYWPAENPELAFYAYGPCDAAGATTGITNPACAIAGTPTFDYAVTGTAPNQTDVIVDLAGKTANKTAVTFNLSHVLTQVMFQAKLSANPNTALTVKIASIKVKAPASAKFEIASGAAKWSGHATPSTEYIVGGTESAAITASATTVGTTLNMIPSSTAATIEVVANAYNKSTNTKVGSKTITIKCDGSGAPNVTEWKAGTKVTYTLTLDPDKIASGGGSEEPDGGTAIEFGQPSVNEWTTGTGDINM